MSRRRQSHEPGHRRKFLVVIDETRECDRAVYYAARRAARTAGGLVLLAIPQLADVQSQWFGVAELMRVEAGDKARSLLDHYAARARVVSGVEAELLIREGEVADAVLQLIEEDEDIAIMALAAGQGHEGPGPLVSRLAAGTSAGAGGASWASLPIPLTIVPGALSDAELDALA